MKKLLTGCLAAVFLLSLCGCGGSSGGDSASIASLEKEIAELQERIAELEEENAALKSGGGNSVSDNTSTDQDTDAAPVVLSLNTMVSVGEVFDITITGAEWADSVLPSNTSDWYNYYEDKENETYFVVRGTITSHAGNSFDVQWNSESSVLVNEKYNFTSNMGFENADGKGFGDPIKPLQTRNFVLYASVSDEVYNISENVQVNFALPDNEEQLGYFYDEDHSNASFTISFSDLK